MPACMHQNLIAVFIPMFHQLGQGNQLVVKHREFKERVRWLVKLETTVALRARGSCGEPGAHSSNSPNNPGSPHH